MPPNRKSGPLTPYGHEGFGQTQDSFRDQLCIGKEKTHHVAVKQPGVLDRAHGLPDIPGLFLEAMTPSHERPGPQAFRHPVKSDG